MDNLKPWKQTRSSAHQTVFWQIINLKNPSETVNKVILILGCFAGLWQISSSQIRETAKPSLTGNLQNDLISAFALQADSLNYPSADSDRKSSLNAALYSAILPGAGQVYTESYVEAVGFVAAEVGLWVVYAVYNSRGDSRTNEFQDFADLHWSVVSYVQWMKLHYSTQSSSIVVNSNTSLPPWERVDWNQLNTSEDQIGRTSGTGFTHRLPRRPDQQYYELIGKYPQYGGGWDDAGSFTPSDLLQRNLSSRFLFYSQMRGEANDFFRIASTASYFLIANHVLSALEAAWSAARFNSRLNAEAHLVPREWSPRLVEFVPTVRVMVEF